FCDPSTNGWEVANQVFQSLSNGTECCLVFPLIKDQEMLLRLADVINRNSNQLLMNVETEAELYPESPAPFIKLSFPNKLSYESNRQSPRDGEELERETVKEATAAWVDNFLGKNQLCPYTASRLAAAIGLKTVGVRPGPVEIRTILPSENQNKPAATLSYFWSCVSEIANTPEEDLATFLLCCPDYDEDFSTFVAICDGLVQASIEAVGATDIIGRAWFHPLYETAAVGHSNLIPGHALPHEMVHDFVKAQSDKQLSFEEVSKVNDLVRKTPHATINILRRSQLVAAQEYEMSMPKESRPKANSVYVRNVERLSSLDG
ncbi:unnamed protein product, partial [Heterosigma akashiwo]